MTEHNLTEALEITDEMAATCLRTWLETDTGSARADMRIAMVAALAVGGGWEPLNGGRLRVGDEVRQDVGGIARTAVVGRVDADGDPWTAEGVLIGTLGYGTWHVRRPARELPTEDGAQIIPAHEAIEAVRNGVTYRAARATYDAVERIWVGIWRGEGGRSTYEMPASLITLRTAQGVE